MQILWRTPLFGHAFILCGGPDEVAGVTGTVVLTLGKVTIYWSCKPGSRSRGGVAGKMQRRLRRA